MSMISSPFTLDSTNIGCHKYSGTKTQSCTHSSEKISKTGADFAKQCAKRTEDPQANVTCFPKIAESKITRETRLHVVSSWPVVVPGLTHTFEASSKVRKRKGETEAKEKSTHTHDVTDPRLPVEVVHADDGLLRIKLHHIPQIRVVHCQKQDPQRHQHHVQKPRLPSHLYLSRTSPASKNSQKNLENETGIARNRTSDSGAGIGIATNERTSILLS